MNGLDYLLCIVAQRMPNILQALHQRIIGYRGVNPNRSNQFILTDEPFTVFNQILQNFKRLATQFDLVLTVLQTTTGYVEHEFIKRIYLVGQLLHVKSDKPSFVSAC